MISNRAVPAKGPNNFGNSKAGKYLQDLIRGRDRTIQAKISKQIKKLQTIINDCAAAKNTPAINNIVKYYCIKEAGKGKKGLLDIEISLMVNIIQAYANTRLQLTK